MELRLKKRFQKNRKKLPQNIQNKALDVLILFRSNPYHRSLRRHALKGKKYKGCESIDVTGDIRIILNEQANEIIDIIDIGSHSYLY